MEKQQDIIQPLSMPFLCYEYNSRNRFFPIPDHWHYFLEILLCKEGNALVTLKEEQVTLHPGEMLIIRPLAHHAIASADGGPVVCHVVKLNPDQLGEFPDYFPNFRALVRESEKRGCKLFLSAKLTHESHLDDIINECVYESETRQFAYDLKLRALMYMLLVNLIRLWTRSGYSVQDMPASTDPIFSIPAFIDRHLREGVKVEELAKECGLSYPWFAKKFRELYGVSCKEFISQVRICKVEHFLLYTDFDLNRISQETGYADCSHMIKDFRQQMNMTPGQYRLAMKKGAASPGTAAEKPDLVDPETILAKKAEEIAEEKSKKA